MSPLEEFVDIPQVEGLPELQKVLLAAIDEAGIQSRNPVGQKSTSIPMDIHFIMSMESDGVDAYTGINITSIDYVDKVNAEMCQVTCKTDVSDIYLSLMLSTRMVVLDVMKKGNKRIVGYRHALDDEPF